jgi:hypothetical protein
VKRVLRNTGALIALFLAGGCSSLGFSTSSSPLLEIQPTPTEQPSPAAAVAGAKAGAATAKLTEALEISAAIRSSPASAEPWIVCVRGKRKDDLRTQYYSVYFVGDVHKRTMMSGIVDHCEDQTFSPLS